MRSIVYVSLFMHVGSKRASLREQRASLREQQSVSIDARQAWTISLLS